MDIREIEKRMIASTLFDLKDFSQMPDLNEDCAILIINAHNPVVMIFDVKDLNEEEINELVECELRYITSGCNYRYQIIRKINNCYFCN